MILRRITATFLLFVLTGMFASPALAAVGTCVLEKSEGCCCAEDEATEVTSVAEPGCECPACACMLEESDATFPFYPTTVETNDSTLTALDATTPAISLHTIEPLDRTAPTLGARGPPLPRHGPLYILYDTLLI